jgi:hypothetical protein
MSYKVLGQNIPAATTATDLYTVPTGKSTVVSSLAICNEGAGATYRIAVRQAGASLTAKQYLVYDASLPANGSDFLTLGLTLAASDVVTVYSSTGNVAFSAFGDES